VFFAIAKFNRILDVAGDFNVWDVVIAEGPCASDLEGPSPCDDGGFLGGDDGFTGAIAVNFHGGALAESFEICVGVGVGPGVGVAGCSVGGLGVGGDGSVSLKRCDTTWLTAMLVTSGATTLGWFVEYVVTVVGGPGVGFTSPVWGGVVPGMVVKVTCCFVIA
jgi:hypothetical protein